MSDSDKLVWGLGGLVLGAGVMHVAHRRGAMNEAPESVREYGPEPKRATVAELKKSLGHYKKISGGHDGFARWCKRIDDEVLFPTLGMGMADLHPRAWRVAFDKKVSPVDAVAQLVGPPDEPGVMLQRELELG